jgi:hypothetical protein
MMRVNRLGVALQVAFQALLALGMAVGATILLQRAGTMALLSALLVLLTLFFFAALALLRALPVRRSYRYRRGDQNWRPPRGPRPVGPRRFPPWPDFGGVREPRRPFPPGIPPRAAAAEPEPAEH